MTDRARKLLEDARTLSVEEQADLVAELLASLPADTAEALHADWIVEIERRARDAWTDQDGGHPWAEVEDRLRSRLRS